jgi:hypothetical protein
MFDFLRTVSQQLKDTLEALPESVLDDGALAKLLSYQQEAGTHQGVYVIHYDGIPKYVGKANHVRDRLAQHLTKLRGRRGITPKRLGYKTLLLDKSMSTAANEDILIGMFKDEHEDMWNGGGFGPKDPGKERDTTKPGKFDREHPIVDDFQINLHLDESGVVGLGKLLSAMKAQLPYVFRYDVPAAELSRPVSVSEVPPTARDLLQAVVTLLGEGWRGAIISYGMVLYKTSKHYPHGEEINP